MEGGGRGNKAHNDNSFGASENTGEDVRFTHSSTHEEKKEGPAGHHHHTTLTSDVATVSESGVTGANDVKIDVTRDVDVDFDPLESESEHATFSPKVKFVFPWKKLALAIVLALCGTGFLLGGLIKLNIPMLVLGGLCILPGVYQLAVIIKTCRRPTREAIERNYEMIELD